MNLVQSGRYVALLAGLTVSLFVAACGSAVGNPSGKNTNSASAPTTSASSGASASASPSSSSSENSSADSCLTGTWTYKGSTQNETGLGGFTLTFNADGSLVINFANSQPLVAAGLSSQFSGQDVVQLQYSFDAGGSMNRMSVTSETPKYQYTNSNGTSTTPGPFWDTADYKCTSTQLSVYPQAIVSAFADDLGSPLVFTK